MATSSTRTIRIQGIDEAFTTETFTALCTSWHNVIEEQPSTSYLSRWLSYKPRSRSICLGTSLAVQRGHKIATVSFGDQSAKMKARDLLAKDRADWVVDDTFDGITVLHSSIKETDDIDICAIHGLHGNAFDTWEAGSETRSSMWLRDYLPHTRPFEQARIMTFGYSSQIWDGDNVSEVRDWAKRLLFAIGAVREVAHKRNRPIIFVCHSLGGIVAREAMILLDTYPKKYSNIRIEDCGLLFLGTPHSGTTLANWNAFLSGIAAMAGIRTDVIDKLRSFNGFGVESKEAFSNIISCPPHYCLYETRCISIGGKSALVVTKDSAGLNAAVAFPMPDADHRQMCKFENKFAEGYTLVVDRLGRIRGELRKESRSTDTEVPEELPGHPLITAPRFPLPTRKAYYEGRGLLGKGSCRLVGRATEYAELQRVASQMLDGTAKSTAISLSGIGGIGKSELILTFAARNRNICNIFFVRPDDAGSFTEALLSIANSIGTELLAKRHLNQDLHRIWSELTTSKRIEGFYFWLSADELEKSFFLLDDIDVASESAIIAALPQQSRNILITTRNPVLVRDLEEVGHLKVYWMPITNFTSSDMVEYTSERIKSFLGCSIHDTGQINAISRAAVGHPLVVSRIVSYIATNLTEEHGTQAVENLVVTLQNAPLYRQIPAAILRYKPMFQDSIAETFEKSRNRLPAPDGLNWTLMQLIAFMVHDDSAFIQFLFHQRPWIFDSKEIFAFHHIWSADENDKRSWLSSLRKVSLGTGTYLGGILSFHPVLIQYIQEQMEDDLRINIIRDIMLLAIESMQRSDSSSFASTGHQKSLIKIFSTQALHCAKLCRAYGIEDLGLTKLAPSSGRFFELARV